MSTAMSRSLSSIALGVLLGASRLLAFAGADPETPASLVKKGEALKIAVTAEDHLAKAAEYAKRAASYHEEAARHRRMFADYAKTVATSTKAPENPWLRKMRDHCDRFIKDAESLASEAEKFANFHRMRAAELQGN